MSKKKRNNEMEDQLIRAAKEAWDRVESSYSYKAFSEEMWDKIYERYRNDSQSMIARKYLRELAEKKRRLKCLN